MNSWKDLQQRFAQGFDEKFSARVILLSEWDGVIELSYDIRWTRELALQLARMIVDNCPGSSWFEKHTNKYTIADVIFALQDYVREENNWIEKEERGSVLDSYTVQDITNDSQSSHDRVHDGSVNI